MASACQTQWRADWRSISQLWGFLRKRGKSLANVSLLLAVHSMLAISRASNQLHRLRLFAQLPIMQAFADVLRGSVSLLLSG